MLAIIAYKNLFPRDFSDLKLDRGFVAALFASKGSPALAETESLKRQISEKRNVIHEAEQEKLLSLKEQDIVFDAKRKTEWGRKLPLDQEKYEKRKQAIENRIGDKLAFLKKELLEMEKACLPFKAVNFVNYLPGKILTSPLASKVLTRWVRRRITAK